MTPQEIDEMFTYHPPEYDQIERMNNIRAQCMTLAHLINQDVPICGEQALALRHIQMASMLSNAAIVLHDEPMPDDAA